MVVNNGVIVAFSTITTTSSLIQVELPISYTMPNYAICLTSFHNESDTGGVSYSEAYRNNKTISSFEESHYTDQDGFSYITIGY